MIDAAVSFFYNFILEGFAEIDGINERKRQQEQAEKAKREYIDSLQSEIYFDFLYNENDVLTLTPEQYYNNFITKHNVTDEETKEILFHYIKRKYKRAMKDKEDQQATQTTTQEMNIQETTRQVTEVAENVSPSHNDQEVFYLYNNTFDTYNEAFNYACDNDIPVHMIISNKHPFMTNERLQELEKLYTFARHSMTYEQAKEYINYLQTIPETLDQQERLYKLKSILQRLEKQTETLAGKRTRAKKNVTRN
jgi:membrane-associated HD superfamily phosphohydrolase